jgi:hypothetical protein
MQCTRVRQALSALKSLDRLRDFSALHTFHFSPSGAKPEGLFCRFDFPARRVPRGSCEQPERKEPEMAKEKTKERKKRSKRKERKVKRKQAGGLYVNPCC